MIRKILNSEETNYATDLSGADLKKKIEGPPCSKNVTHRRKAHQ